MTIGSVEGHRRKLGANTMDRLEASILVTETNHRATKINSHSGIRAKTLQQYPCLLAAGTSAHGPVNANLPDVDMQSLTLAPKCTYVGDWL